MLHAVVTPNLGFGDLADIFRGRGAKTKFFNGTCGYFHVYNSDAAPVDMPANVADHSTTFAWWRQQHKNRRLTFGRIPSF